MTTEKPPMTDTVLADIGGTHARFAFLEEGRPQAPEKLAAQDALESRKLIERAKGILMQQRRLNEAEKHYRAHYAEQERQARG